MKSISEWVRICHDIAKDKGFWDKPRNHGELIALMHSELSEALEYLRQKDPTKDTSHRWEQVTIELADLVVRVFDFCGAKNLDLESALEQKVEYNKTRPYRHGKRF